MSTERLAAEVEAIHRENEYRDKRLDTMGNDIKQLLELANKSKGGFWAGMAIASGLGGILSWVISHIKI